MIRLPPVLLAHAQDLHHTDEDVQEVELEADALVDRVLLDQAPLRHARVVQDLLDVVEGEATEDGQTAVQPDALRPHQRAGCGGGEDEGRETGESDDGDTREQRTTEVHVLLLLSGGADEGDRAHHPDGVETSAGEDRGVHEHQRGEQGGLSDVESGPEAVLQKIAISC